MPAVTPSADPAAAARDRKRRQRERQRAAAQAPLLYSSEDWQLFLRRETLPQKAGCEPYQLGRIVLKELTDNACDSGSENVTVEPIIDDNGKLVGYRVADDGPGVAPADIPKFFAINRPLLSSKLKRLPLRGMLGNGLRVVMGAVAAFGGTITVNSRGHRLALQVDKITGQTSVASDGLARPGTVVEIKLPIFDGTELGPAKLALEVAHSGVRYTGPSQPGWYGPDDLRVLFARVQPATTTVAHIVRDVFKLPVKDARIAGELPADEVAQLHHQLREMSAGRRVASIGCIGNDGDEHYSGRIDGVARIGAAEVPFCVECWAACRSAERSDNTRHRIDLLLNRSPTVALLVLDADSKGLWLNGCGLNYMLVGGKRAKYTLRLSLITPYVLLTNDGKAPLLDHFREAIRRAVQKAAGSAYRAMIKPPKSMYIKTAAWQVMEKAYLDASENLPGRPGRLPAKVRQIMYAARPEILELTGLPTLKNDSWITQHCVPDFIDAFPEKTADWKVIYDARGDMIEPHTGLSLGLGTAEVDAYLEGRPRQGPATRLNTSILYPTHGPKHRYKAALYIEKQGFSELMEAAQIQERFDMMVMSNKGMSVTATRKLIDHLVQRGLEQIFVLHDLDISGFSIIGTLGTSARRYTFKNTMPIIDVGLRLEDVRRLGLQSESFEIGDRTAKPETTRRNGATQAEIDFLYGHGVGAQRVGPRRVELNAMTSRQIIELLERKFAEHGVTKVVPDRAIIEEHARRLFEQKLTKDALDQMRPDLAKQAAAYKPPRDLVTRVRKLQAKQPELSWDQALAQVQRVG